MNNTQDTLKEIRQKLIAKGINPDERLENPGSDKNWWPALGYDAGMDNCTVCLGNGYLYEVREGRAMNMPPFPIYPCACLRERQRRNRDEAIKKFCKLPAKAKFCTFKTFDVNTPGKGLKQAFKAAKIIAEADPYSNSFELIWLALVAQDNGGRIINNDTGKSHLAMAICNRFLERGLSARYTNVVELDTELKFALHDGNFDNLKKAIMEVPLLVLDDLGGGRQNDKGQTDYTAWFIGELEAIFNHREDNRLLTVVTSNLTLNEIGEQISYRIMSRIERADPGLVIEINAPSYTSVKKAARG